MRYGFGTSNSEAEAGVLYSSPPISFRLCLWRRTVGSELASTSTPHPSGRAPTMLIPAKFQMVAADLTSSKWGQALEAAGFDRTKSTVFLAEGLMMYLGEGAVKQVLSTARRLSGKGSVFLISAVNKAGVKKAQSSGEAREPTALHAGGCPDSAFPS